MLVHSSACLAPPATALFSNYCTAFSVKTRVRESMHLTPWLLACRRDAIRNILFKTTMANGTFQLPTSFHPKKYNSFARWRIESWKALAESFPPFGADL